MLEKLQDVSFHHVHYTVHVFVHFYLKRNKHSKINDNVLTSSIFFPALRKLKRTRYPIFLCTLLIAS